MPWSRLVLSAACGRRWRWPAVTGGQVVRTNPGAAGCVNQYHAVTLVLGDVGPSGAGSGTGSFGGTLTHHRRSIFGTCVTYSATISGSMSLTF